MAVIPAFGRRRIRSSRSSFFFGFIVVSKSLSKNRTKHKNTSRSCLKSARNSASQGRECQQSTPCPVFPHFLSSLPFTQTLEFSPIEPFVVTLSIPPSLLPSFPSPALLFPVLFPLPPLCMLPCVFPHLSLGPRALSSH